MSNSSTHNTARYFAIGRATSAMRVPVTAQVAYRPRPSGGDLQGSWGARYAR
jgi:hypothetical protein